MKAADTTSEEMGQFFGYYEHSGLLRYANAGILLNSDHIAPVDKPLHAKLTALVNGVSLSIGTTPFYA